MSFDFSGLDESVSQLKCAIVTHFASHQRKFDDYMKQETSKLATERKRFEEECRFMYGQYGVGTAGETPGASAADAAQVSTFPNAVKVNVGGRIFQTTLRTLQGAHVGESDSMLAAMFSQRHPNCKDADGNVFIDRDGDRFAHQLDYLITGNVAYFESLRRAHRQLQHEATPASGAFKSQSLEYEQMLVEARYFQLRGIVDVLQPCLVASMDNAACFGVLTSESHLPVVDETVSWMWQHQEGRSNTERYTVHSDGTVTFAEGGAYLIMARVPGVSSGNNGYAVLKLDDTIVGESWSNNANGYHNMIQLNEVLQISAGARLQLQGMHLSQSFSMNRALATSLTIGPLQYRKNCEPFISLQSPAAGGGGGFWSWEYKAGNCDLVRILDSEKVKFLETGTYLIMARMPGVSSNNTGAALLKLNDTIVGECWSNNGNGYHNMIHFSEVLQISAGGQLQLQNNNLSHSFNMKRPLATVLTAVRLGCIPGTAHQDGEYENTFIRYASFSSNDGNGGFWTWSYKRGCSELAKATTNGNEVTISQAGTYLIMVRVPGVSASNNGYVNLKLDDTVVGESWSNNANGHHNTHHFNQVLQIAADGRLQLQNINLSHSFNMNRALATSFTILLLAEEVSGELPS